jgi:hypothetical protein
MLTEGHAAVAAVAAAAEALPSKRQQRYNSKAKKNTRNILRGVSSKRFEEFHNERQLYISERL